MCNNAPKGAFFMIIGICGLIGSGKDTAADYLVNFHGYRRESFAASLKDAVAQVFGWDRQLLEGRTAQSRAWREQPDEWWSQRLGQTITPRHVLQYWGTEVIRNGFHDDMWIASLENKIRTSQDNVVITDCRFPNEIRAIRAQGGRIIWIQRGPLPAWFDSAVRANCGELVFVENLKTLGVHPSETAWAGTVFDAEINNNDTIDELFAQLKNLVSKDSASRVVGTYVPLGRNSNTQS
jgi:hypothetical protein